MTTRLEWPPRTISIVCIKVTFARQHAVFSWQRTTANYNPFACSVNGSVPSLARRLIIVQYNKRNQKEIKRQGSCYLAISLKLMSAMLFIVSDGFVSLRFEILDAKFQDLSTFYTYISSLPFFNSTTEAFLHNLILSKTRSRLYLTVHFSNFAANARCEASFLAFFSRRITLLKKDFQNIKGSQYLNTIRLLRRKHNTNEQTDSKLECNDRRSSNPRAFTSPHARIKFCKQTTAHYLVRNIRSSSRGISKSPGTFHD